MAIIGKEPAGATPLTTDDSLGLIPTHITTRSELDAWEQQNILVALSWLHNRKPHEILDDSFLRQLHWRMFNQTWRWAGQFRARETNIGVTPATIATELHQLCKNFCCQRDIQGIKTVEFAVRFHRDLVWVHAFPNGNSRHARLATDLLVQSLGMRPFSWGGGELESQDEIRQCYLAAFRMADRGDYSPLIKFATA